MKMRLIKVALIGAWLACTLHLAASKDLLALSRAESSPLLRSSVGRAVSKHIPIGKMECKECHADRLNKKNVHPVADECATCHEYSEKGDAAEVKLMAEGGALCFTCHSDKEDALKNKTFKHPPAEADCTICHDPHSSNDGPLLKMKVNELCFTCHTEKQEDASKKKFTHAPVADLGCATCHNPHASDVAPMLKADKNTICMSCHKVNFKHQKNADGNLVLFANTTVAPDYVGKAKKIMLSANGKGHPYVGHPVTGVSDPSNKEKSLGCTSCHNPHFGNYVQRFQRDLRGQPLCDQCHK